jgi:hypothetical protein
VASRDLLSGLRWARVSWRRDRKSVIRREWLPDPSIESHALRRNLLAGWLRIFIDDHPAQLVDVESDPASRKNAVPACQSWLRRQLATPIFDWTVLERAQHELLAPVVRRILGQFKRQELPKCFMLAIEYRFGTRKPVGWVEPERYSTLRTFCATQTGHRQVSTAKEYAPVSGPLRHGEKCRSIKHRANTALAPLSGNRGLFLVGRLNQKCGARPAKVSYPKGLPAEHMLTLPPSDQLDASTCLVEGGGETVLPDLATTAGNPPAGPGPPAAPAGARRRGGRT